MGRGFTLVELLIVMGIIGLVVGMSLPAMVGFGRQARLKTTTRQLMGLVSLARSLAISSREDHAVVLDAPAGRVQVMNLASGEAREEMVRLPSSVTVEFQVGGEPAPEPQFVFRPNGALAGRTVALVLTSEGRERTITVTGATGAVSVN
jgi:prepilin-type N-terminal cleavage/methylation domain-containing protein